MYLLPPGHSDTVLLFSQVNRNTSSSITWDRFLSSSLVAHLFSFPLIQKYAYELRIVLPSLIKLSTHMVFYSLQQDNKCDVAVPLCIRS